MKCGKGKGLSHKMGPLTNRSPPPPPVLQLTIVGHAYLEISMLLYCPIGKAEPSGADMGMIFHPQLTRSVAR